MGSPLGQGLKFLVAGAGVMGRRHARHLTALGATVAFWRSSATTDPTGTNAFVFTDYSRALGWGPQGVLVCTPSHRHLEFARDAVVLGADVFIEKPIAHRVEEVAGLLSEASRRDRQILVGCNLRFLESLRKMKFWLAEGEVGLPKQARIQVSSCMPDWRADVDYRKTYRAHRDQGGGVALDLIHEFDYALWFFGPARRVEGRASRSGRLDIDCEDTLDATVDFVSGTRAEIHMSFAERPPARICRVEGERGSIEWDLYARRLVLERNGGVVERLEDPAAFDVPATYATQMEHWIRVVRREEKPAVTGEEGLAALRLALAARDGKDL